MTGTIRNLNFDKGFGFIQTPKGDYFFHRSGMTPEYEFMDLRLGQHVEFDPNMESPKGPRAENVRVVSE